MKVLLAALTFSLFALGVFAKPEKGSKKSGSPEGRLSKEEMIKKFDKDGDGKLSKKERAEIRRRIPQVLVKKFDKDEDGKLNDEERAEARQAMEARKKEALAKFDKDGDGKLNPKERKAAMASRPQLPEVKGKKSGGKGKKEGDKKKKKES